MDYQKLASLLFPNLPLTVEEIEKKYPPRNLEKNQVVSRYAPSPTGYMHIGNFFQMFIAYNLTRVTGGKFFLRIEDTDSKREKKDATKVIYEILDRFGIKPDEYQTLDGVDIGNYGPYVQSQRVDIYKAYAKKLVSLGRAFPCFCQKTEGKDDVLKLREDKWAEDDQKEYDPCRNLTYEEIEQKIANDEKFAIRLKTKNEGTERIKFFDLIKGEIEAKANAKDFVLLKNDFVPPYAFAHAIDDTLMGTTIVVRGEEYISSTPAHLELFEALDFKPVTYCHNPLICKIGDEGNRRKISKRFDPEADMRFYFEEGFPTQSVLEYLLNIINSGFEIWRNSNPQAKWTDFKFGVHDITAVAPIFDLVKLADVSKNVISKMTATEVYDGLLAWAKEFNPTFAEYLENNTSLAVSALNIDREKPKPRKDIAKFSEIEKYFSYIWYDSFEQVNSFDEVALNCENREEVIKKVLTGYAEVFSLDGDNQSWFDTIKVFADKIGFAGDTKAYKQNPTAYIGSLADLTSLLRIALTGRKNTPDLFEIMKLLGSERIKQRLLK